MHGPGDGHVHAVLLGQLDHRPGGLDAFDDEHGAGEVVLEAGALAQGLAAGAVAAFGAEAGGGQVARAGDAEEGLGPGAHGGAEPGDLGQSPGEEGGFGVVPGAEAVDDAGGDGDDILGGAGQFHAEQVGVGVHPHPAGGEQALDLLGKAGVVGGGHHGRGQAAGQFRRDGRAGQAAEGAGAGVGVVAEDIGHDLGGAQDGGGFQALGDGKDPGVGGHMGAQAGPGLAHELDRDGGHDQVGVPEGLLVGDGDPDGVGQFESGQAG